MKYNLSGTWQFALDKEKAGLEQEFYKSKSFDDTIDLPTTTAEAKKGEKGTEKYTDHLTETYHFEGYAWYLREIEIPAEGEKARSEKRFFFSMERTRKSTVWVDGEYVGSFNSFYVEHKYELTRWLTPGKHILIIMIDNTDYVSSGGHMTSPDTQTNWNGILGEIYLESVVDIAIDKMWIYPSRKEKNVDIRLQLSHCGTLLGVQAHVNCQLTKLKKKKDRDFEHFEPLYTQTVQTREEWSKQRKEYDVPYSIEMLEMLPDQCYEIMQSEELDTTNINVTLHYPLGENAKEWDEYNPYVYMLTMKLMREGSVLCEKTSYFGLRDFTHKEMTLYCNDKEIFLRGTHDAMIFPLTGYAPMDLDSWLHVYGTSKEYGLNHYRYHTCCPPKAAYLAAAYLGIYIQAELAFWGSIYDVQDEHYNKEQQDFLLEEGIRALDAFGDLPSYFGMSMGNELWGSKEEINRMMGVLKVHDNRHLYTQGSNNHQFVPSILANDDFFSGVRFSKDRLFRGSYAMCDAPLGFVQLKQPGAYWNYDEMILPRERKRGTAIKGGTIQIQYGTGIKEVELGEGEVDVIPHVPVISHEIGQYAFTPDFHEISYYTGVLQAENMKIFRKRMEEKGLLPYADDYFRASGKFAADCYKLELEAAFRSVHLSGFQLLDIKDYAGQGTALVGIFNAFHKNKGAITRADWRMFCSDAVLLPTLDSFIMKSGSCIDSKVMLRYYRPQGMPKTQLKAVWYRKEQTGLCKTAVQTLDCQEITGRGLFTLGTITLKVPKCKNNAKYVLRFSLIGDNINEIVNEYNIFVYEEMACQKTDSDKTRAEKALYSTDINDESVCITNDYELALKELKKGKAVLVFINENNAPANETLKGEYCTDFWCYPMFRAISEGAGKPVPVGTMGLLIDVNHPALKGFACEEYTTAQWYQIVMHSRPMILDNMKETQHIKPIVRMMDNFERNHNLGLIYEVTHENKKMLVCHADLTVLKEEYPEAACLYRSLAEYVKSESF